jgi:hypothetical protein
VAVTVQTADITEAEQLLLALVSERYPSLDLGPASAVRELLLTATAPGLALVLATARDFTNRLSFTTLSALTDAEADAAADALAANLFVERRSATRATITGRMYFTNNGNHNVPANAVFVRDGVSYRLVDGLPLSIGSGDLVQVLEGTTNLYYFDVQMETVTAGQGAETTVGVFQYVTPFAFDLYRAEVVSTPVGGVTRETTAELIARIPTALTTRNLVNRRAITHSLLQQFPEVSNILVVGAGDTEMERDIALDNNVSLRFHTGGAVDVYADTDIETVTLSLTVGTAVTREDQKVVIMKTADDLSGVPAESDFVLKTEGSLYLVTGLDVAAGEVEIYTRTPFPQIDAEGEEVSFSLGSLAPNYIDYGTFTGLRTNQTSSTTSIAVTGPVYRVRQAWRIREGANDLDITSSLIRVTGASSSLVAQSQYMVTRFTSDQLQVDDVVELTFDRPTRITDIQTYLSDALNRTVCADVLARARHPVYVSATIYYEPAGTTYTSATAAAALNAALGDADEICSGDIVRALAGAACVKVRTLGASLIQPDGTAGALTVATGTDKLTLPVGLGADVSGRTVRFVFDAADITLVEG